MLALMTFQARSDSRTSPSRFSLFPPLDDLLLQFPRALFILPISLLAQLPDAFQEFCDIFGSVLLRHDSSAPILPQQAQIDSRSIHSEMDALRRISGWTITGLVLWKPVGFGHVVHTMRNGKIEGRTVTSTRVGKESQR